MTLDMREGQDDRDLVLGRVAEHLLAAEQLSTKLAGDDWLSEWTRVVESLVPARGLLHAQRPVGLVTRDADSVLDHLDRAAAELSGLERVERSGADAVLAAHVSSARAAARQAHAEQAHP